MTCVTHSELRGLFRAPLRICPEVTPAYAREAQRLTCAVSAEGEASDDGRGDAIDRVPVDVAVDIFPAATICCLDVSHRRGEGGG